MLVVSSTSNLGCEAGCGLMVSVSDHARIMLGSAPRWKWRLIRLRKFSRKCCSVIFCGRRSIWWGWRVTPVAPRIANDVEYVRTIKQSNHFAWEVQYLWWSSSVTFRGRCSTWWSSSVTFRGRCSRWWMFECKIGRETLYFTIENACGELEK